MRSPAPHTPVVLGRGLVTALGRNLDATWTALTEGRAGIAETGDAPRGSGMALAASVEPPRLRVPLPRDLQSQAKFLNPAGELAVEAAAEAVGDAGDEDASLPPEARGLWLAQMDAGDWSCVAMRPAFSSATDEFSKPLDASALGDAAVRGVKPFFLLESLKNNAFSFLSAMFRCEGANTSVSGFAAGTVLLLDVAARALSRGDVDRALVVGAASLTAPVARRDLVLHGLARPDAGPDATYRPFDRGGSGVVPGEGASALALARAEDAPAGGAPRIGLLGFGAATGEPLDGLLAPTGETLRRAAEAALEEAHVRPGELQAVVLPSLGLPETDAAWLAGLEGVPALAGVPVVSWRGATGHAALASDGIDLLLASRALETSTLPGSVGCREPLDAARGRVLLGTTTREGTGVLVVAAGLQGEAAAWVLARITA